MPLSSDTLARWLIVAPLLAALPAGLILILDLFHFRSPQKQSRFWLEFVEKFVPQSFQEMAAKIGVLLLKTPLVPITFILSSFSLVLSIVLAINLTVQSPIKFLIFGLNFMTIYIDPLSIYFVLLVNIVVTAASFYTGYYLNFQVELNSNPTPNPNKFHFFFNLFHFTMVLVAVVDNLVLLWIAVELTTLASTFLIGYRRDREALEAAWKYLIITSTGIIFALLGTFFLANAIPANEPMNWSRLVEIAGQFDKNFIKLSFLFILVGYGTKAGLAPMHTWLPDGHGEAPYPVSALLSGVLLKSALYVILRFYTITNIALADNGNFTSPILLGAGLFSLVIATPFILKQNPFKRVLAYHSLEHMGIITFGLGIGGNVALLGALLHSLNHALTKALMFLAFGNVQSNYVNARIQQDKELYVGVLRAMPITGILLTLGGLALVGSPLFNIFFSEFIILWVAITNTIQHPSFWSISAIVLFLISITLIFGGLSRHLGKMLIDNPPETVKSETIGQVLPLVILLFFIILFGVTIPKIGPFDLPQLLRKSVEIVCKGGPCQ